MKNLGYGAATILIGDAAGSAILRYASALVQAGAGDVIDVPTCNDDGSVAIASLVLGPGIPVLTTNAPDDILEPDDWNFVAEIGARAEGLLHSSHAA
jgi:hypothetical protein